MERLKMVRWAVEDRQRAIGKRLGYNGFVRDDRDSCWVFDSRHVPESRVWARQPANFAWFLAALSLQAVLPVTILFSIVVPLYFAWGRWIEWKLCPVAVATYVSLFLKFPPWVLWSGEFFWVWPGFI
ncbi:hypothetical protein QBZ16_003356 [Prototheca wickerhamii]|uniref:Uncharacterized protein n=1 Tax=Prototheca wickerhamii TaxID=3111 RepID=A0AAD9IHD6_PROWI|nr:hypothetical protein QBZ16_003356 [Prototheca wickerhamii]